MKVLHVVAWSGFTFVAAAAAAGAPIVSDGFNDNNPAHTEATDAAWFHRSANEAVAVGDDSAGIGTGNALKLTLINGGTQTDRPIIGTFPTTTLGSAVGSVLSLSFDFRFAGTAGSMADGFRFGLYNSNGSPVTADATGSSDNDFGYQASIGTGTTTGVDLFKETSNGNAGELGTGTDRTSVKSATLSGVAINDQLKHNALFTLTRTATGVNLATSLDGVSRATGADNTTPFTTFDEIVVSHGPAFAYNIDNVLLDVPEPGSLSLLAWPALGLLARRRTRRSAK